MKCNYYYNTVHKMRQNSFIKYLPEQRDILMNLHQGEVFLLVLVSFRKNSSSLENASRQMAHSHLFHAN